ncbi:MAG: response regulator transcription factor [Draconibacterium sp.]|nr:response regulator transcription factor [Draconibacterium sp.]
MSIKAFIIDNEPESIFLLKILLTQIPEISEICTFNDSVNGFESLKSEKPDILFLDLQMPGLSGMEILRLIDTFNLHVHVVIITGHEKLILDAAHFSMIDYLLKPIDKEDLIRSLEKFNLHKEQHQPTQNVEQFSNHQTRKIRIPTSFEELFFATEDIYYLEADGNYTNIYTRDGNKITSSFHLGKIQQLLQVIHFTEFREK